MISQTGDIDIDFPNRTLALSYLEHIPASIIKKSSIEKHNTGVYFHTVPMDPFTGFSSIDYHTAELSGFYKIDLLNVGVYEQIQNEQHLLDLMSKDLNWDLFEYSEFTSQLIHLGKHSPVVAELKPKSLEDVAMILALIRPGKKHLIPKCRNEGFNSIKDEIWVESTDGSYFFKKSHAIGYAMLVKVHANLIIEQNTVD